MEGCDLAWKRFDRHWIGGTDLTDLIVDLLHSSRECFGLAMATDVHEVDLGFIEEQMIVQRRHLKAGVECGAHDGVDLVLEHDGVAHHGYLFIDMRGGERSPRREAYEGRHGPLVDLDFDIRARFRNLEHALFGDQLSL